MKGERERWVVGFEREEERFGGGEGHGRRWEEERRRLEEELEKTWI